MTAAPLELEIDLGLLQERLRGHRRQVVAVESDVERAHRERFAQQVREPGRETVGQRNPARADADEDHVGQIPLPLRDLVGHPVHHAPDSVGVEDARLLDESLGLGQSGGSVWAASRGVNIGPLAVSPSPVAPSPRPARDGGSG